MIVNGTVGGVEATQGQSSVKVLNCESDTDPDSVIASKSFRKAISDLMKASTNAERGGLIYRDADGSYHEVEYPNISRLAHCESYTPDELHGPAIPTTYVPTGGVFHTHLWRDGTLIPLSCDPRGAIAVGGPSEVRDENGVVTGDYAFMASHGNGTGTGYLADADGFVWRWNSSYETPTHPSKYQFEKDANGKSSCLKRVTY
jgi:hypothetical protein